jgi:hypothetical protein
MATHAPAPAAQDGVILRVQKALFEALPALASERMVDLLEFIAMQHPGHSFNPDNTAKALEIAAFCRRHPYAVSPSGVASLARLARHALGSSDGGAQSAEHQLWLLTSGALNTAAAILEHEGDAVALFEAIRQEPAVRGRYVQRLFAQAAMQDHLQNPEAFRVGLPPPDVGAALRRQLLTLGPVQLALAGAVLFVAVIAGVCVMSESATYGLAAVLERVR